QVMLQLLRRVASRRRGRWEVSLVNAILLLLKTDSRLWQWLDPVHPRLGSRFAKCVLTSDTPHKINGINADAIRRGLLKLDDPIMLERHFGAEVQLFETVSSVYFGNPAGGLANAGREGAAGALYVMVSDNFARGALRKHAIDRQGNRTDLLATVPDFDARVRPWYTGAVTRGTATWSPVYVLSTGQDMAIAASRPVYDERQHLLGVVSVDLFLSQLGDFMKGLEIGKTGKGFIVERSGLLIASSTGEKPFTAPSNDGTRRRIAASESASPQIRVTAEHLTARFGDYGAITAAQYLELPIAGERHFVSVSPVQDEYGLDWLVVTVIPESDFMAEINANNRTTAWLVLAAGLLAIILGGAAARRIAARIARLQLAAQSLAKGESPYSLGDGGRIGEISALTRTFDFMAEQLRQTLGNLTAEIAERKCVERELQNEHGFLTQVVNNMGQGLTVTNAERRFEFVNPAYAKLFGYRPEDLMGKRPYDVTAPEDHIILDQARAARARGETTTYETRLIRADGTLAPVLITGAPRWKDGKAAGVIAVITDLTEITRVEEEVRALSARYQAILAAVPDIIMEVDNNKVYTWANQAGIQFFGADVISKEAAFYFEGEQDTYQVVQPLFNGKEDVIYVESWQCRHDGEKRLLAWWCRTLKDAQGNAIGALSTARDTTEQKRAEATLQAYSERLDTYPKSNSGHPGFPNAARLAMKLR
ncbi:MAG: PAS domain S-box protein, partial [Chloroflexi bacterium]|nr:PAS domain S-box protein [Chloroflexota bacterium]